MSMKNKFVTAVTTAGLLAGILGSAFVPSVKAAAGVIDWSVTGGLTVTNAGTAAAWTGSGTSAAPYLVTGDNAVDIFTVTLDTSDFVDEFGVQVTGTVSISATGTMKLTLPTTINTAGTAGSFAMTSSSDNVVAATEVSATASGTGTVTLSLGGVSKTYYFLVSGPAASLTLTNAGATHLAGGTASTANKLELAVKDSSGTALAAPTDASVTWEIATASAGAIADVTEANNDGKYSLATTACDAATSLTVVGDTAKSFTARAKIGDVYSNYVSVKCTDDGSFAVLTGVAIDASTYDVATAPKVNYTFQDGFGNLLGEGATVDIDGVVGTGMAITALGYGGKLVNGDAAVATLTPGDGTITTAGGMGKVQQTITSTATKLGKEWMVIKVADKDLATAEAQAASYTVRWTLIEPQPEDEATITKSKYTLTADFGDFGAKKKISFVVENVATGSVVTYSRKANSLGKATYTIGRKGTFEVYAMLGDEITDSVVVKR